MTRIVRTPPRIRWIKRPKPVRYDWRCDRCPAHVSVNVELSAAPVHRCLYTDDKGKSHIVHDRKLVQQ